MKTSIVVILVVLAIAVGTTQISAQSCTTATCFAASPSEPDFLAALPSSSNTNATVVVNIPAGASTWATGFNYTVPSTVTNLTIQGATTVNCTGTAGTSSYSCAPADGTTISDGISSSNYQIQITTGAANTYLRIAGLSFQGTSSGFQKYGTLAIYGNSHNVRIDDNHFNIAGYPSGHSAGWVRFYGPELGVVDHNVLDMGPSQATDWNGIQVDTTRASFGDTIGNGDGTFQNATPWGTINFIYIENNQFNGGYANDCYGAGLFVTRYNKFYGMTNAVQNHSTKSSAGPWRGCRAYEFYHNYIAAGSVREDAEVGSVGSTSLVWGNTMESGAAYRFWAGNTERQGGATIETKTPTGWGYCGTAVNGNGVGSQWDGNQSTTTGYPCLDGLGRGQTVQALNGVNQPGRLNSGTGTIAWPQQYLEPIYLWDNSFGSSTEINIRDTSTTQNVDIFADNASFDGTTGTGYGLLSGRPSSCTAGPGGTYYKSPTGSYGVAYWATDANAGQGELYVCTSTNTWTPIYQPFTYPHPLVAGTQSGGNPPNPPQNLTATVE